MSFFRRGGLDKAVFTALDAAVGGGAKVLAWARTADGHAVGLVDRLAVGAGNEWQFVQWHEIETGGWNREAATLRWTRVDGVSGSVALVEAGGLPGLFKERVDATIVVSLPYQPVGSSREARIIGRRGLGADHAVQWGWWAPRRDALSAAAVRDIEAELARIKAEYEAG